MYHKVLTATISVVASWLAGDLASSFTSCCGYTGTGLADSAGLAVFYSSDILSNDIILIIRKENNILIK